MVPRNDSLKLVNHWNRFFGLFLCFQRLVGLNNLLDALNFGLVSFNLIIWKFLFSESLQQWNYVFGSQVVLGKAQIFKGPVHVKHLSNFLNSFASKIIVAEIEHFQILVHQRPTVGFQHITNLT